MTPGAHRERPRRSAAEAAAEAEADRIRHVAGKPPRRLWPAPVTVEDETETITPDGPATDTLFVPLEESNFETDNQGRPLKVHDEIPRTGFGSARHRPKLGPAAKAVLRVQRAGRAYRVAYHASFVLAAVPLVLTAVWLGSIAWDHRNDLTLVELRETTPVLAISAAALWMVVVLLWVLWRTGRIR